MMITSIKIVYAKDAEGRDTGFSTQGPYRSKQVLAAILTSLIIRFPDAVIVEEMVKVIDSRSGLKELLVTVYVPKTYWEVFPGKAALRDAPT